MLTAIPNVEAASDGAQYRAALQRMLDTLADPVTQSGHSSGGYCSTFATHGSQPPLPAAMSGVSHQVFVVDRDSRVPGAALALQASGRATLVAPAPLDDGVFVSKLDVELPGGLTARIRLGESFWGTPTADVVETGAAFLAPK